MHLVGFVIRIYHDARSSECKIQYDIYTVYSIISAFPDLNDYIKYIYLLYYCSSLANIIKIMQTP